MADVMSYESKVLLWMLSRMHAVKPFDKLRTKQGDVVSLSDEGAEQLKNLEDSGFAPNNPEDILAILTATFPHEVIEEYFNLTLKAIATGKFTLKEDP
jgi:hypothetical protein